MVDLTAVPLPRALTELDSSPQGLTSAQAQSRLARYGPNENAEKHRNPVLVFLGYFWAPIPWMIGRALAAIMATLAELELQVGSRAPCSIARIRACASAVSHQASKAHHRPPKAAPQARRY